MSDLDDVSAESNADPVAASKQQRHQRLDTTARYTQPTERDLEKAVERLETR